MLNVFVLFLGAFVQYLYFITPGYQIFEIMLDTILEKKKHESLYRSLQVNEGLIDFCSNDYLRFARNRALQFNVSMYTQSNPHLNDATGSRTISGNTKIVEGLVKIVNSQ